MANDVPCGRVGSVNGISYRNEDILAHNPMTGAWAMFFDGSDVGINGNVDAFARLPDGDLLLSLADPVWLSGVGLVDDSDVIRFTPTSLGARTSGTFAWYFDGSDVGLTSDGEDIDAIAVTEDGDLLISTLGRVRVPNVLAVDEDLLRFTPSHLGQNTAGRWTVFFDGSDVGLRETTTEEVVLDDNSDDMPDDVADETTEEGVFELFLPFVSQEADK